MFNSWIMATNVKKDALIIPFQATLSGGGLVQVRLKRAEFVGKHAVFHDDLTIFSDHFHDPVSFPINREDGIGLAVTTFDGEEIGFLIIQQGPKINLRVCYLGWIFQLRTVDDGCQLLKFLVDFLDPLAEHLVMNRHVVRIDLLAASLPGEHQTSNNPHAGLTEQVHLLSRGIIVKTQIIIDPQSFVGGGVTGLL